MSSHHPASAAWPTAAGMKQVGNGHSRAGWCRDREVLLRKAKMIQATKVSSTFRRPTSTVSNGAGNLLEHIGYVQATSVIHSRDARQEKQQQRQPV